MRQLMSMIFTRDLRKESRSLMNVTFRLPSEELDKQFIAEAAEKGLVGIRVTGPWAVSALPFIMP